MRERSPKYFSQEYGLIAETCRLYVISILMWGLWKLFWEDTENTTVIDVKKSQWLDMQSAMYTHFVNGIIAATPAIQNIKQVVLSKFIWGQFIKPNIENVISNC